MVTMKELNETNQIEFIEILKDIYEHSPWIPEKAADNKPFSSFEDLHEAMVTIVSNSTQVEKLKLIKAHPNLGARMEMSTSSVNEQAGVGLNQLSPEEFENFSSLNKGYMDKFGFPFIMAVKGCTKNEIYEAMKNRVTNDQSIELETALLEIYKIAQFRLKDLIES